MTQEHYVAALPGVSCLTIYEESDKGKHTNRFCPLGAFQGQSSGPNPTFFMLSLQFLKDCCGSLAMNL